jgi:hydroxymethylbilane synthase
MRPIRIATRASKLAMIQTSAVADRLTARGTPVEIVQITTHGDRSLDKSLTAIGGDGIFVKELERALLEGRADVAVHSMKDVPTEASAGICFAAVLEREDARDALISRGNAFAGLAALPQRACVGTSSLRRRAMLLAARPDAQPRDLRGNVDTRVRKVIDGEYDAAIIALAGLTRIGLLASVGGGTPLPFEQMMPAAGQGAICAQCRSDDDATNALLAPLDHEQSNLEVTLERAVLRRMGGGCLVPIGVHAAVVDKTFTLEAIVVATDGSSAVRKGAHGVFTGDEQAIEAAHALADEVLAAGGRALVDDFRSAIARGS